MDTRIAIAQNLVRIYREVLEEPVPSHLLDLLARLEVQENGYHETGPRPYTRSAKPTLSERLVSLHSLRLAAARNSCR